MSRQNLRSHHRSRGEGLLGGVRDGFNKGGVQRGRVVIWAGLLMDMSLMEGFADISLHMH